MILRGVDGHTRAIVLPEGMKSLETDKRVKEILERVKAENPDEWLTWEDDIEPAFQAAGFTVPCWFNGPIWDE